MKSSGFCLYNIISFANSNSFTSSFTVWMTFISFSYLIAMVKTSNTMLNKSGRAGIFVLFEILEGKLTAFTIEYDISCRLLIYELHYVEIHSLYGLFVQSFYRFKCAFNFVKCIFCSHWGDQMIFTLYFVRVVYWFVNVKSSLHPWNRSHLIIVYDSSNVVLNLACYHYVEDFYIYIHQGYLAVIFFL